ncbi:hypothetical protein DID80_00420 [Candidatus Marinamargulisbacteria bacterium SCGC AAA071-K20]|nr:hypothetical protein DID80_00420 [Candidatus Marinamargulisbacteria bacterium SCGC AAA071-K20]
MTTEKKLYKIGHLAKTLGVTHRTIRYYDQLGLLPHMKRSSGGVRLFDDEDIKIIKQIRQLQKEDYLPLEVIKEKLFEKKEDTLIAIITDSGAILPENKLKKNQVISIFQLDSEIKKELISQYKMYLDKGYQKIYSIHTGPAYSNITTIAKEAISTLRHNNTIEIINSNSVGSSLGLFISQIQTSIENNPNITNSDLLINKLKKLTYQIGLFKSLDFMITPKKEMHLIENLIKESTSQIIPIFNISSENSLSFQSIKLSSTEAVQEVKETLLEEIESRGKYISECMITYSFFYTEAKEIANELRKVYPNTPIHLVEDNSKASFCFGQPMLAAAII